MQFDRTLITDHLTSCSFSFFTDAEIKKLSVAKIDQLNAFDKVGKPHLGGIYDPLMGVSPFDHAAICKTCGLGQQQCTGHVGHIELNSTFYSPFLMSHLHKLLKSKCFGCHRLRIHPNKIDMFIKCLILVKAGKFVESSELKTLFLGGAREVQLLATAKNEGGGEEEEQSARKSKKIKQINQWFKKMGDFKEWEYPKEVDPVHFFRKFEKKLNKDKNRYAKKLTAMLKDIVPEPIQTSIQSKEVLRLIHEIWGSVITTTCPHCQYKTPGIRKEGNTQFFEKPLSEKARLAQKQKEKIGHNKFEIATTSSHAQSTRKPSSNTNVSQVAGPYEDEPEESDADQSIYDKNQMRLMFGPEVKLHIDQLWVAEKDLLNVMFGVFQPTYDENDDLKYKPISLGSDMFFLTKILVPPNRFRPESQGAFGGSHGDGSGKVFLHAHSAMMTNILKQNKLLSDAYELQKKNPENKQQEELDKQVTLKWIQLQESINIFLDSSKALKAADREQQGLRQLLEKKEGMFRMKMMGKRVNFGARSVISPDPYITTDQIGVPVFMAKKLTFPEPVSDFNAERLRKAVINGANQHPGANIIEDEQTGQRTWLATLTDQQRRGLANMLTVNRKIVYRHMTNGDVLLVNRQPTLHKPSIMAHIARILPKEQTIRMHYVNCKSYNADFDGDEMNLHFPQGFEACSEAYKLMATHQQYIVPTSGKPIRGLIQDSVISGVLLSSKDTYLTKEEYQELVYVGLRELIEDDKIWKIELLPPTLFKPRILYTGKQVVSTILKNIVNMNKQHQDIICGMNLESKSKLPAKEWGKLGPEEGEVIIRDNELLQGTIDKAQFGESEYGMVHSFYEIYGSERAGQLLTSLARIFVAYLQMHGFTCGLDDLMFTKQFNNKRRLLIEEKHKDGIKAAAEFCGIKDHKPKDLNYTSRYFPQSKRNFDQQIQQLNEMIIPKSAKDHKKVITVDDPIRKALENKFEHAEDVFKIDADLDNAIKSKMSQATSDINAACFPEGLIKNFPKNNISAMVLTGAKGGIVNMTQICGMLGQQELEGKRVPKMPSGRTLPCFLRYDPNPRSSGYVSDRFLTGLRPQDFFFHCMAGREGLIDTAVKTSRSGYLQRCLIKQLESLVVSYDMTVRDHDGSIIQFLYGDDCVDVTKKKFIDKFQFLENNFTSLITNFQSKDYEDKIDMKSVHQYKKIQKNKMEVAEEQNMKEDKPDPIISIFHPLKYCGSLSEHIDDKLHNYISNESQGVINKDGLKRKYPIIKPHTFKKMYCIKYMKSLVHPGENVGTIVAQSIGEPSTQMTLNTFHLAGHGAANMTLGVPRLKEILMTTPNNIKTPSMTVHFKKKANLSKEDKEKFQNNFKKLKLSDVTSSIRVSQSMTCEAAHYYRVYKVTLVFENLAEIKQLLGIEFKQIQGAFKDKYVPVLLNEINKQLKKHANDPQIKNRDKQKEETKTVITNASRKIPGSPKKSKKQAVVQDTSDIAVEMSLEQEELEIKKLDQNKKRKHKSHGDDDADLDLSDDDMEELAEEDGAQVEKVKQRKNIKGYMQEDEEDRSVKEKSLGFHSRNQSGNLDDDMYDENNVNILKEKYSRYFQNLKGISFDDKEGSATVIFQFPIENKKVLMISVAEQLLTKVLVRYKEGIERSTLIEQNKEEVLFVNGLNFKAFYPYTKIIDVNKIESNDIIAVKHRYGIEAARANIVKEIRYVFNVYGIDVDYRHLSLLADFMTFNGDYRAFNRVGMEESSSPFLKMTFETTMHYLINSALTNDTDRLDTPSGALVLGQIPKIGTGIFDILTGK